MKKKICIWLLAGTLAVTSVVPAAAGGSVGETKSVDGEQQPEETVVYDEIIYVYDQFRDGYVVQKGSDRQRVELKWKINGKPIAAIGEAAFANCTSLEYIEAPDTIEEIGSQAFLGCRNLGIFEWVNYTSSSDGTLLKSLSGFRYDGKIAQDAFEGTLCTSFHVAEDCYGTLPDYAETHGLGLIRDDTFGDFCYENGVYYSDRSRVNFGSRALSGSIRLKFPLEEDGIVSIIGHHAFFGCRDLEEVEIYSEGLYKIEDYAFANCASLRKIVIPHTVREISSTAFDNSGSVVIYSQKGSFAEQYAKAHQIPFQERDTASLSSPSMGGVNVEGNHITVYKGMPSENAVDYEYAIGKRADSASNNTFYRKAENTDEVWRFFYLPKGTYYAFCRGVREEDGRIRYSPWSKGKKFRITSTTPSTPKITRVSVSGRTVKVTYTKCQNATGYDVILGKRMGLSQDEMRPLDYGKLVQKAKNGSTVTVTFANVPKGTYYVGLHAYNRTRPDKTKVFSRWSKAKKIRVR